MNGDACAMAPLVEAQRDGRVTEREAATVLRHLASCAACAALAAELERLGALLQVPPRSPLEQQRGRLELLRAAARPRAAPTPRWAARRAVLSLAVALAIAVAGSLSLALPLVRGAALPSAPPRLARLPSIPRLPAITTETMVVPEGGATFTRRATAGVEIVDLQAGAITLSVRPLPAGERFLVKTSDAEVEVRGTVFRVEAEARGITSVEVTEGKVEVRFHGAIWRVGAAERWARPLEASPPSNPARSEAHAARSAQRPPPASPAAAPVAGEDDAARTLNEGLELADRGDYDAATRRLTAFCEAHPADDRAEDAAFLVIVSMQRAGRHAEARAAARRYLARYPDGYRRIEAAALAIGP